MANMSAEIIREMVYNKVKEYKFVGTPQQIVLSGNCPEQIGFHPSDSWMLFCLSEDGYFDTISGKYTCEIPMLINKQYLLIAVMHRTDYVTVYKGVNFAKIKELDISRWNQWINS